MRWPDDWSGSIRRELRIRRLTTLNVGLAALPVRAVIGGEDARFEPGWLAALNRAGALVQLVPDTARFAEPDYFRALQELRARRSQRKPPTENNCNSWGNNLSNTLRFRI